MHPPAGFRQLLALRGLTVVNDNIIRWLVIGLGKRVVATGGMALVLTVGTAGFVLPFVVLAWLAGWLADRFPKRAVIVWCKFAEIILAAIATGIVAWGVGSADTIAGIPVGLWLLLVTVVMIGCQAALMAPSVIGTIAETVPAPRLSHANGLFAMVTLVATLVGMAAGNWLADATPLPTPGELHSAPSWVHAVPSGACLLGIAVAGWISAMLLVRRPAADPSAPAPWNALTRTWADVAELCADRRMAVAAAGIVFFWGLGAVAQLNVDQFATEAGATSQAQIVPLLLALVAGIALGSVVAGRLSTWGVNLGLVPVGAVIMAIGDLALACAPDTIFSPAGADGWRLAGAIAGLLTLGFGAGMFDVPLEAFFQEQSPPARRGALLAALNLLTFAGMFAASLVYGAVRAPVGGPNADPLLSARGVFGWFVVLAVAAAIGAVWCAPRAALKSFVSSIVNGLYRFRVRGAEFVPATGPAVLVANHLSWLDGFLLPLACPRHVRMVVYGPNIRGRFLNMLADQWRFILFDPRPKSIGRALEAIRTGLAAGDVIGIFCEGGISRTGQILGFKRGLEWLLERVEAPIVPVHIDGLWGSLLSFSEGRYFTKVPRGIRRPLTLRFGRPLPVGTHPDDARRALQELSAESVRQRMLAAPVRPPRGLDAGVWAAHLATAEAFDGCCLVRREDRMVSSLAPGDPLNESLGSHGRILLGIASASIAPTTVAAALVDALVTTRPTLWLARVDQVDALARLPGIAADLSDRLRSMLQGIVMPIGSARDLPRAQEVAKAFLDRFGIEPVTAFAPPEAGGLVAMNSPPARATAAHEVTLKRDSVGRVVNGVVVWPRAADRERLARPPLRGNVMPDDEGRTLVIGATLPASTGDGPRTTLLDDSFDVDAEGFLVRRAT